MSIDIANVTTWVEAKIRVRLSGTPELKSATGRMIQPDYVVITYRYHQTAAELDGWTEHSWLAGQVDVSGSRVLKPGKDGTQRLGKDSHIASWSAYGDSEVTDYPDRVLPEWLVQLIAELRPSGDLAVAGGV